MTYEEYFRVLSKRLPMILLISLFCAVLLFFVTVFFSPKQYEAETLFSIRNRDVYENGMTNADIAASEALTDAVMALMRGLHNGTGSLSFEKLGAGVFHVRLLGTNEEGLLSSLRALSAVSEERIPALLQFASLTQVNELSLRELSGKSLRNAAVGFVLSFAFCGGAVLLKAEKQRKKSNQK
jgi:capsular polysaccharide biosynthesis protein